MTCMYVMPGRWRSSTYVDDPVISRGSSRRLMGWPSIFGVRWAIAIVLPLQIIVWRSNGIVPRSGTPGKPESRYTTRFGVRIHRGILTDSEKCDSSTDRGGPNVKAAILNDYQQ